MSDHTPRTQDVKNCYVFAGEGPDGSTVKPARVLRREFDRWLFAHDRKVAARAWDEGYWRGINGHTGPGNPYREHNNGPSPSRAARIEQGGES